MTNILFAARQAGTASALAPVAHKLLSEGTKLHFAAAGPAARIWTREGFPCHQINDDLPSFQQLFVSTKPNILITGATASVNLERRLWQEAEKHSIPSIAVLDSWTNIAPRFRDENDLYVVPTAILAIDQPMRYELLANASITSRVYVTGQPYIESILNLYRRPTDAPTTTFAFFAGGRPPQGIKFSGVEPGPEIATMFLKPVIAHGHIRVLIKPHPSDDHESWMQWHAKQCQSDQKRFFVTDEPIETLLSSVHGVMGLTSITLIIASLVGLPVLSLQDADAIWSNRKLEEMDNIYLARCPSILSDGVEFLLKNKNSISNCFLETIFSESRNQHEHER